jgi:hypothetical protein
LLLARGLLLPAASGGGKRDLSVQPPSELAGFDQAGCDIRLALYKGKLADFASIE